MKKVGNFILTHKGYKSNYYIENLLKNPEYNKIIYNSECHNDLDYWSDRFYYEMYQMYDIFYNKLYENFDYIQISHYRRFIDISYKDILKVMKDYDIIVPTHKFSGINVFEQFISSHDKDLIYKFGELLYDNYNEYYNVFYDIMNDDISNCFYSNLFIMNKINFEKYIIWLFDILKSFREKMNFYYLEDVMWYIIKNYAEDKINGTNKLYTLSYQMRIGGFLSERLLNVYIRKNNFKIYKSNLIFVND